MTEQSHPQQAVCKGLVWWLGLFQDHGQGQDQQQGWCRCFWEIEGGFRTMDSDRLDSLYIQMRNEKNFTGAKMLKFNNVKDERKVTLCVCKISHW